MRFSCFLWKVLELLSIGDLNLAKVTAVQDMQLHLTCKQLKSFFGESLLRAQIYSNPG